MAYDQINKFYSNPYLSRPKLNPNQKFLVRDWSTYLGWNNNRYNIEAALLLAKLLDRTLVLPAFVYANSCEYPDQECAAVTPMFTSGVPVDLNQVSDKTWYPDPDPGKHTLTPPVPTHNWKGWVLPIEKMLDLDHIISTWGYAIKLDQFHKLTNPDPSFHSIGMNNGKWNLDFNRGLSYRMVPNAIFTNFSKHMVDRLPKPVTPLIDRSKPSKPAANSALIDLCESTLGRLEPNVHRKRTHLVSALSRSDQSQNQVIHKWDESLIRGDELNGVLSQADNPMLESCLASNNFRSFYAYNMSGWWMKAPYGRTKHVRRVENLLGWWDELHDFDEQILHIEGELHNGFPPGVMEWRTMEGRNEFERLTRSAVRPPEWYHEIAARLELKMRARCGGRSWVGAHMRRGDFLQFEWAANNITNQWKWIEHNAVVGATLLQNHPELLKPGHEAFNTSLQPPAIGDPIYVATNIRKPEEVEYIRTKNIILLSDLLDDTDRSLLGIWSKFMDILSILEQCLLMRSGFFYGDAHSSFDGWILNRRVFHGISEEVTKIEYLKLPGDGQ